MLTHRRHAGDALFGGEERDTNMRRHRRRLSRMPAADLGDRLHQPRSRGQSKHQRS